MNQLPLFYKSIVPLSKERHGNLYVKPPENFKHAREANSIYITAVEFPKASREYPIVFGKDKDGALFPVVLLGLQINQNLFVNNGGKWLADYIPAYVRRYPFILAADQNNREKFTVCLDEAYAGFNNNRKGQQLFDDAGNETETLKQTITFLREFQNQVQLTTLFCNKISELGIIESMQARIEKDGKQTALGSFMCVNRQRLKDLPPEKMTELVRTDMMELIYAHLASLNNIEKLLRKAVNGE